MTLFWCTDIIYIWLIFLYVSGCIKITPECTKGQFMSSKLSPCIVIQREYAASVLASLPQELDLLQFDSEMSDLPMNFTARTRTLALINLHRILYNNRGTNKQVLASRPKYLRAHNAKTMIPNRYRRVLRKGR